MSKINTDGWKKFKIDTLFTSENTGNVLTRDVEDGSGEIPYVTASGLNNGVAAYIDAKDYKVLKGNCILVGGKTFTITYQEDDFISNDSHNFVLKAKKPDITKNQYMFLITIIRVTYIQKYSWGDAVTKTKMLNEDIVLPAKDDKTPDWDFMDTFIYRKQREVNKALDILNSIV